ncbi:MAG: hypothetical protein Kow00123_04660 [Anaerolineales bacterium]
MKHSQQAQEQQFQTHNGIPLLGYPFPQTWLQQGDAGGHKAHGHQKRPPPEDATESLSPPIDPRASGDGKEAEQGNQPQGNQKDGDDFPSVTGCIEPGDFSCWV